MVGARLPAEEPPLPRPNQHVMTPAECRKVLGVGRDATHEEIRKAYRRRMLRLHPDLNGGDHSRRDEFERTRQAYRLLDEFARHPAPDAWLRLHERADEPFAPLRERVCEVWRRYGYLPTLAVVLVASLAINRAGEAGESPAARPLIPYYFMYLGAIFGAAALWGAAWWLLARPGRGRRRRCTG